MITVTMTVHHGNYRHTESATATTAYDALFSIVTGTDIGTGYGPRERSRIAQLARTLECNGTAELGWANYEIA